MDRTARGAGPAGVVSPDFRLLVDVSRRLPQVLRGKYQYRAHFPVQRSNNRFAGLLAGATEIALHALDDARIDLVIGLLVGIVNLAVVVHPLVQLRQCIVTEAGE